jgi:hypothetical protein
LLATKSGSGNAKRTSLQEAFGSSLNPTSALLLCQ